MSVSTLKMPLIITTVKKARSAACSLFVLIALMFLGVPGSAADDTSTATTFAKLKLSLAIIQNSSGVGTAFCVGSSETASYYVTNAHVVGTDVTVNVYRQAPDFQKMIGTVIARGLQEDPDLAVVRVPVASIPALRLQLGLPREGDPIAVAGYPTVQYSLAAISGDLAPSVHTGTISTIANRGGILEYDAQTLPGNSGGPLFDPRTGNVLGVVRAKIVGSTDANVGIGIGRIVAPFLKQNNIAYQAALPTTSDGGSAVAASTSSSDRALRTLPGADVVVVVYDTSQATGNGVAGMIAQSASDFASKFGQRFGVRAFAISAQVHGKQDLIDAAHKSNALITVNYGSGFHSMGADFMSGGTKWEFKLSASIGDAYGQNWLGSTKSKNIASLRDVGSAVISSFADLNDQVIDDLYKRAHPPGLDDSATVNLFRYALPMANGDQRAFYYLKAAPKGAQVTFLLDVSPAAEAGLQLGDLVLSENGVSLLGKTDAEIAPILAAQRSTRNTDLLILAADGSETHIKFELKDIRWYVERRASISP